VQVQVADDGSRQLQLSLRAHIVGLHLEWGYVWQRITQQQQQRRRRRLPREEN